MYGFSTNIYPGVLYSINSMNLKPIKIQSQSIKSIFKMNVTDYLVSTVVLLGGFGLWESMCDG